MKKILVTGASGFIGSFLVEEAIGRNWQVWAGIRKNSSREYLQDKRIQFIDLNFVNKEELKNQLNTHVSIHGEWDYIVHNAGATKCLNASEFDRVNHQFTRNFIDALNETGNIPDKFLLMSSLSVYGPGDEVSYIPIKLTDTPAPNTAYGRSKLKAEQYLQSVPDFPYIILRPTGVYGPREKDYFMMIKTIRTGFDLSVGFKSQHLTFIYVKDLVKAVYLALESPLKNKAYFVTDGDLYNNKAYTQIIKNILGKRHIIRIKLPLFVLYFVSLLSELFSKITQKPSTLNRDKYNIMKQRNWDCEITLLEEELNFKADYFLSKGIRESIEWYKANGWL